jgi:hypothetical protein
MTISGLVFGCVFGGAMLGILVRSVLPNHHLSEESKDIVKLGTGLIGTMAALVLGLLVSSAKSSYDTKKNEITEMSADILLLDRVLAHYGPETADTRRALRAAATLAIDRIWLGDALQATQPAPGGRDSDAVFDGIHQLSPASEKQRTLLAQARDIGIRLGRMRLLLFEQAGSSISVALLVALVFWLTAIFVSFGLFSPRNATVIGTLFVCALSVSSALFLILELDRPFDGVIQISQAPMRAALMHIGV